jgi:hypothetical protein
MNAISKTNKPRNKKDTTGRKNLVVGEDDDAYHFRRQKIAYIIN